jgi:hypothetical protein
VLKRCGGLAVGRSVDLMSSRHHEGSCFLTVIFFSGVWSGKWTAGWQYWLVEKLVAIIKFVMVSERSKFSQYGISPGHVGVVSCHCVCDMYVGPMEKGRLSQCSSSSGVHAE